MAWFEQIGYCEIFSFLKKSNGEEKRQKKGFKFHRFLSSLVQLPLFRTIPTDDITVINS